MAETMQFDLVCPERHLASTQASAVQIPGADGDLTAMPGHSPLITTLRPGLLRVDAADGTQEYVVTGGVAEIGESVSVLAENAVPRAELTRETMAELIEAAKHTYEVAKAEEQDPGLVDDAAKLLSDMVALGDHIGLN